MLSKGGATRLRAVIGVISIRSIAIFIGSIEDDLVIQQVSMGGNDLFYHVAWNCKQDHLAVCQCFFRRTDEDLTPKFLAQALCPRFRDSQRPERTWVNAAKGLAMTAIDLLMEPDNLRRAKSVFQEDMAGR